MNRLAPVATRRGARETSQTLSVIYTYIGQCRLLRGLGTRPGQVGSPSRFFLITRPRFETQDTPSRGGRNEQHPPGGRPSFAASVEKKVQRFPTHTDRSLNRRPMGRQRDMSLALLRTSSGEVLLGGIRETKPRQGRAARRAGVRVFYCRTVSIPGGCWRGCSLVGGGSGHASRGPDRWEAA